MIFWIIAALLIMPLTQIAHADAHAEVRPGAPLSEPFSHDQARNVVDSFQHATLESMQTAGLESARIPVQPWTSSYWPYFAGAMAIRFADPGFPVSDRYSVYANYILGNLGQGPLKHFSPAEKYDLLVGDRNFTMTRIMAGIGRQFSVNGNVATWMGFCDGWAPASFMVPRPRHSVTVTAVDGQTRIEFLPSDIKALATLLWARGSKPARFIGSRCTPRKRRRAACKDTNAGTWHLAVVNQVGASQRSLIMDIDHGYEVWNHPISSYQYRFFNPVTGQESNDITEAKTPIRDYRPDPYARGRSRRATHLVGVVMQLTYIYEDLPNALPTDDESRDILKTVSLKYDLELDAAGQIVGGEWYSEIRPDFLWVPEQGARAVSVGDAAIARTEPWLGFEPLPMSWARASARSTPYHQPLARIVETLVQMSSR